MSRRHRSPVRLHVQTFVRSSLDSSLGNHFARKTFICREASGGGLSANHGLSAAVLCIKHKNALLQVESTLRNKEKSSEPAFWVRGSDDAARAAIMGQARQASLNYYHIAELTLLSMALPLQDLSC